MKHRARQAGVAAVVSLATCAGAALMTAAPATADGYCGQDYTGPAACAITTPGGPYNGSIVADNDTDYYVFHAAPSTHLSVSLLDSENPACTTAQTGYCGDVQFEIVNADDSYEDGPDGSSNPEDGLSIPLNWSTIIPKGGTYYLLVSGNEGTDANGNPIATPYSLTVNAAPNIVWPPPPTAPKPAPVCTVPNYQGAGLATINARLRADGCEPGRVRRIYSSRVRWGHVIKLSEAPGTQLGYKAKVGITVSKGKRPRHHH